MELVETNVEVSDISSLTFSIAPSTANTNINYFSLTSPISGSNVCVKLGDDGKVSGDIQVPLGYVVQSSQDSVSGSIDASVYSLKIADIQVNANSLSFNKGENPQNLVIPLSSNEALKKAIEDQVNDDDLASIAEGHFFGINSPLEMILKYSYTLENSYSSTQTTPKTDSREVKFYITAKSNCYGEGTVTNPGDLP